MLDAQKRKRGRPPRKWPNKRADSVTEYCQRTGESRKKVFEKMKLGLLRYVQDKPGAARRIPHSEYTRQGYDLPDDAA
jgi:hypothetical protein